MMIKKRRQRMNFVIRLRRPSSSHLGQALVLIFAFVAAFGNFSEAAAAAAAAYNCELGCDLSEDGGPACGVDSRTYFTECLAACQGVSIAKRGEVCDGKPPISSNDPSYARNGIVSLRIMQMHKERGYNYVARRIPINIALDNNSQESSPTKTKTEFDADEERKYQIDNDKMSDSRLNRATTLVSPEGDEYVSDGSEDTVGGSLDDNLIRSLSEAFNEDPMADLDLDADLDVDDKNSKEIEQQQQKQKQQNKERKVAVIGSESRSIVLPTTKWPYRLIGELRAPDGSACTAFVVSKNSVATAAHCVYDKETNQYKSLSDFSPGQYRASKRVVSPFGSWAVGARFIYDAYKSGGGQQYDYDIAIIHLNPQKGKIDVGMQVGYAGVRYTEATTPQLQLSRVPGYPIDKPSGQMWQSSACVGNSGSPLMDLSTGYVHGIHFGGVETVNMANILRGEHYTRLAQWSGRSVSSPLTPYKPPTSYKIEFQYDQFPAQTSWLLKEATGARKKIAGIPRSVSRKFGSNKKFVSKSNLKMKAGRVYVLTLLDKKGNGNCCKFGKKGYVLVRAVRNGRTLWTKKVMGRFKSKKVLKFKVPDI